MLAAAPLHHATPLWHSAPLSAASGREVFLKMDCFQPAGSFKLRGMGRRVQQAVAGGATRVVTSSGGNAGLAVAWAARRLDVRALVLVPRTTSEFLRARIRDEGGDVIEHGESWDDAHERAQRLGAEPGSDYVHPFDHETVWEGNASVIEEAATQGPKPGLVVAAVGGGGLLCGILTGMHRVGWADVPVLAVETEGAASFQAAVSAGAIVKLDAIRSLATTLGARAVTPKLLEWKWRHAIANTTVTDRQAVDACLRFADDHRVLVEPACGAALAVLYDRSPALGGTGPVLVEVCGGAGVSLELLGEWKQQTR